MNNQERIVAALLGLMLVAYMIFSGRENARRAEEGRDSSETAAASTNITANAEPQTAPALTGVAKPDETEIEVLASPDTPEEIVKVDAKELRLELSSHGAVIKSVLLKEFNSKPGEGAPDNPPVLLDFTSYPGLQLKGFPGLAANAAYKIERGDNGRTVVFKSSSASGLAVERKLELLDDYQVKVTDTFENKRDSLISVGTNSVCVGSMYRGQSKNDIVSVDALPAREKAKVLHWDRDKSTRGFIGGAGGFGCRGGSKSAVGMPDRVVIPRSGPQKWVAVKSRFFVTAFSADTTSSGYEVALERDISQPKYVLSTVGAKVFFPGQSVEPGQSITRNYTLFVGPKKLDMLNRMNNGMDGIMQFGRFSWFCKMLVFTLNFFHKMISNYGVAIILLTILVRIIFWPLTHRSTQSMRRMQELQPELKALQAKFKDNPQKLQQETWAVYKKNKVNPLSSCLPMLVQIPVFIALFTVLRSAVELRYAPFLWIADLSEPENLFADTLPIALNILPLLMSGTMALQSYLTPTTGDAQQQKMMMVIMPVMMLFMFYRFPSALSLYWTVSQVLAIVQMLLIRRHQPPKSGDDIEDAVVVPTRQQRRQSARS